MEILFILVPQLIFGAVDINFSYNCSSLVCSKNTQRNSKCDTLCMNPSCNYDSHDYNSKDWALRFLLSECFYDCVNKGCQVDNLTISCDPSCDIPECGFGLGACGYCASGCSKEMLLNNKCDPECNTRACMYDNNACGWCAPNCFKDDLNLPYCKTECSVPECNYQNFVCNQTFCAPNCTPDMQKNQLCDQECNQEACNYDNLMCNHTCTEKKLMSTDICYPECNNKYYSFQNGVCGDCNSGCYDYMLGNWNCDFNCWTWDCGDDLGDCGCAYGCYSFYTATYDAWWWWDTDNDGCKSECLVESCLYNYGICKNKSKIRAAWFQQIINNDFSHVLNLAECYEKHPECTEETLWEIDQSGICVEACNNKECLNCMGIGSSLSCARSIGPICLICLDSKQVYDYCFHSSSCPPGFRLIPELNDVFLGAQICLRDPAPFTENYPFKIYVNQEDGNDENDGSIYNPVRSLSVALQISTRFYNEIFLTSGRHNFTISKQVNSLSLNPNSPLEMLTDLKIKSILIQGNNSMIYLVEDDMKFKTLSSTLTFNSLIFNGTYALSRYCDKATCVYCPALTKHGNIYINDRSEIVHNIEDYAQNCSRFSKTDFISVSRKCTLNLNKITVVNFRQQLRTFIYSQGHVHLLYIYFSNIQNYKHNYFITQESVYISDQIRFSFDYGEVNNFNNGYEYSDLLEQAGFLKITNVIVLVLLIRILVLLWSNLENMLPAFTHLSS